MTDVKNFSDQPKDVAIAFVRTGAAGRVDEASALLADECECWYAGAGSVSREDFVKGMRGLSAVVENKGEIKVIDIIQEGNRVALEYTSHIPLKNGKIYTNAYLSKFVVKDGKITVIREYLNPLSVMEAFGALNP